MCLKLKKYDCMRIIREKCVFDSWFMIGCNFNVSSGVKIPSFATTSFVIIRSFLDRTTLKN